MTDMLFSPGAVVRSRSRLWRVDAQEGNILVATTIDGSETEQHRFYLPFEDVQPAQLEPPAPDRIGHLSSQDLLLRAYRLSLLHGSAPLLSLQSSRVIPTNYQLVPVMMALDMPRVRLLIADDVGLGKTIEAGLIVTELLARQRATRLLVICPASLREQWREALDYFFHLDARIISTRHRREMERQLPVGADPWGFYRYLITSVDYAKTAAIKNQILEQDWDIVLIDEAHQVAKPHQAAADQRVQMDRWELAEAVAHKAKHLLLLTATPHSGYSDSFASLLRMLEVNAVLGPSHAPTIHRSVARKYVCQRRRLDVEEWFGRDNAASPFRPRDQHEAVVMTSETELAAIGAAEDYGELVLQSAEGTPRKVLAGWTVLHLHKRALSSPAALRESLKNRESSLKQKLEGLTADDESAITPGDARAETLDEYTGEQLSDEEVATRLDRAAYGSPEAIRMQLIKLQEVMDKAKKVTPARDSKLQFLLTNLLYERLNAYPRAIIFTRYKDTLDYLEGQIGKQTGKGQRYAGVEIVTLYGDLNEGQRRDKFRQFERARRAVMIATDAISEGINLQHACNQVIHYELPWNPNRLEQRNGRVDRFGQKQDQVVIRTLVMNETLDAKILKVLVEKAERIRRDYGFAPPYFGDDTNILALIREQGLDVDLSQKQLSLFDWINANEPTPTQPEDPFADETIERIRDESFYGQTHISLPDVEKRLRETYATVGSPDEIRKFVLSGLDRFRCRATDNGDGTFRIVITNPNLRTVKLGDLIERATFDAQAALDDPTQTALDLGHPLVRRLMDVIKHSAFREDEHYGRAAALVTPDVQEVTALFHLLARYVVHTEPLAIVEELTPVAMPVYGEGALDEPAARKLLNARPSTATRTRDEVSETLRDLFDRADLEQTLDAAVEARRQALVAERKVFRERLESEGDSENPVWLKGIDQLSLGSRDVLTVTVYYPR